MSMGLGGATHFIPLLSVLPPKKLRGPEGPFGVRDCAMPRQVKGTRETSLAFSVARCRSVTLLGVVRRAPSFRDARWRRLAPCGAFSGKCAIARQRVSRKRQLATVDDT